MLKQLLQYTVGLTFNIRRYVVHTPNITHIPMSSTYKLHINIYICPLIIYIATRLDNFRSKMAFTAFSKVFLSAVLTYSEM